MLRKGLGSIDGAKALLGATTVFVWIRGENTMWS